MASVQQRRKHTLQYFDRHDYPLTKKELEFWLHADLPEHTSTVSTEESSGYAYLKNRKKCISVRQSRRNYSLKKWQIAKHFANQLKKIESIEAIFVTGALAMDNCPENDDIDIMIVCAPNTLWLTRLRVFLLLNGHRRPPSLPEHSSDRVSNKICDNLYLDTKHLRIVRQDLYTAHEILQAKCVFDRSNCAQQFLIENAWVKSYLPGAYPQINLKESRNIYSSNIVTTCMNAVCFVLQYIYMMPKITHEKISLHSAFFHPRK